MDLMDLAPPNWVERRKLTEANLVADIDYVWRDIKQALEDSVRSFNSEYGGSAESKSINGHRFRIFYVYEEQSGRTLLSHRVEIDIDFDKNARKVKAESPSNYSTVQRYLPLTFAICADHASAYLCDKDDRRIIADEFARLVLEPLFFPKR